MPASTLESLMTHFAARHTLDPLTADADGGYHLRIDERLDIRLFQSGGQILLESSLGPLPPDDPPEQLERTLHLQLTAMSELEEVLTLNPEDETLVLFRRLPADRQTLEDFEGALERFVNQLERWTRELSQPASSSAPTTPPLPALQLFFP
ncbi:CesT family type III secretion system chaperone [Halochromatium roseum]|uniref:CesT family type III secretion system chaperone n=1 Tax=Halochromatium roseum TaxID=391920 RepID=UPI00191395A2|nr:CesT family type III secretion system chaperone [Halochromatium roseum]MBK5941115.1 hypothetical protein [Halochromatium roseum]